MKIGIDVSQAVYGTGVSDYTIDLVRALKTVDPTNRYVLFGTSLRRHNDLKKLFRNARLFRLPPMLLYYLWNYFHIINIENFIGDVDVFHSSDWAEPPAAAPKVTTVHDLSPFLFPDEMASGAFRNISSVHQARMNWVVRECAKIICVSRSTADDLMKLFRVNPGRIAVIPEAMPARFHLRPAASEIIRQKTRFGLHDYIISIGTPQPRKNIPLLVNSFLHFQKILRLPEKLVIVGGRGWGITDIPDDPRIIFTGFLPDLELAALLKGAQVLAYPSLYEGFGLPILMAFFHQIPVLTSDLSSMPEVAGDGAVLVDPKNGEAIAYGLARAIKDKSALIRAGLERLKQYSWEQTARETLMVYSSLC